MTLAALMPLIAAIPYFRPGEIPLGVGGLAIQPWGVMVAAGFMLGSWVCQQYAKKRGIDPQIYNDIVLWLAGGALVFGHIGHAIYEPGIYLDDPIKLFKIWDGLSSMGGFIGCTFLSIYFFRRKGIPVLRGGDILMIGLAFGFFLGRVGCFIVHDHPGIEVQEAPTFVGKMLGPIAVQYPSEDEARDVGLRRLREGKEKRAQAAIDKKPEGAARDAERDRQALRIGMHRYHVNQGQLGTLRFDLGLTDAILALGLFGLLAFLARTPQPEGLLLALTPIVYMPVRFGTDFLRAVDLSTSDTRYGTLTPAQWGSIAMFTAGVVLLVYVVRTRPKWPEPGTQPWVDPAEGKDA